MFIVFGFGGDVHVYVGVVVYRNQRTLPPEPPLNEPLSETEPPTHKESSDRDTDPQIGSAIPFQVTSFVSDGLQPGPSHTFNPCIFTI